MLVLGASAAFAGDSDVLKAITKEKDYAKAVGAGQVQPWTVG